jgi:hypothetical protein
MLEGALGKKKYATTKFSNVRAFIDASAIIGLTSLWNCVQLCG